MIIGVAGKYCAGKDTLVGLLQERGFRHIDVDAIGHLVLEEKREAVAAEFGSEMLDPDGRIDRKRLGNVVFRDSERRKKLEGILHPAMVRRVTERIAEAAAPVVINAAVLFPMGLHRLCDKVICVTAPFPFRLRRALRRDGHSLTDTWRRLTAQKGICPKLPWGDVDIYRVSNWCGRESLGHRLENILQLG